MVTALVRMRVLARWSGVSLVRFCVRWVADWGHKVGVLLPAHATLIAGLADGADPLAKLLAAPPLPASRHIALGYFLLQIPTYEVLTAVTGWPTPYSSSHAWTHELAFLGVLFLVACAAHVAWQRPLGAAMLRCCLPAKGGCEPPRVRKQ
jgi:peptidoglycan/LPS O-acetylase OafA/YrhL